jgi:hypothetical protein
MRPGEWSGSRPDARVKHGARFTLFLLFFALLLLAQTPFLAPLSRVAPLGVLVPTVGMILFQLVSDARSASRTDAGSAESPLPRQRQVRFTYWIAAAGGLVFLFGFQIASAVFLLLYLRTESDVGWGRAIWVTAGTVLVIYATFVLVAGMRFPPGWLF